jgi:predicted ATPase
MFSLILDPRFKFFCLVSSFIKYEQRKVIVENYDTKSLHPMLLKCHEHLHPLVEFENDFANQGIDEDFSFG